MTRFRRSSGGILLGAACMLLPIASHQAQVAIGDLVVPRLAGNIRLDGIPDDTGWNRATVLTATMLRPVFEGTVTRASHIRIGHDGDNFLVAATLLGNDVRGNSLQRDRFGSDDTFRILIDSFDDNENAVGFATTPTGVRVDFSVAGDGQSVNYDWNSLWYVETSRTDSSWSVEMRIPFSSLRFQTHDGRAVMGLVAVRTSAISNEIVTVPAISPRFSNPMNRVSAAQQLVFEGVEPSRDLRVFPYALGGGTRVAVHDESPAGWHHRWNAVREFGGDLKWGITSNLTLDITANTDFAQAEVDDQQVNLSRFGLFFPEKRQFFLERAGVFDFNMGGIGDNSRLFHSRQIGLTEQGAPLRLLGGARLVGRAGAWDVAALDMQTEGSVTQRAENLSVLRVRRQLSGRLGSTVGGLLTNRFGDGGEYNTVFGADALLRFGSNDYVTLQAAQSIDDERPTRGLRGGAVRALWERRADQGLVYRLGAKWSGPDHDPELGFLPRRDFTTAELNIRYGWFYGDGTPLRYVQPSFLTAAFRRNADGVVESASGTQYLNFGFKNGIEGNFAHSRSLEVLPRALQLATDVSIPEGKYTFGTSSFFVGTPPGWRVRSGFSAGYGTLYDGRRVTAMVSPSVTISRHLELGGEYHYSRTNFTSRGQTLNTDIARLRLQTALDTRFSASGFIQYNAAARLFVSNVRFRVHLREGRDLFVVYNEQLNIYGRLGPLATPRSLDRTLLVKMVYGFTP